MTNSNPLNCFGRRLFLGPVILLFLVCFIKYRFYPLSVQPITEHQESKHEEDILFSLRNQTSKVKYMDAIVRNFSTSDGYCDQMVNHLSDSVNKQIVDSFEEFYKELHGYNLEVSRATKTNNSEVEGVEGHSGGYRKALFIYWNLVKLPFVQTVCETGFNAGHSTLVWLTGNSDAQVYSFDIGMHQYARKMGKYLQKRFPRRLMITWGDSTKSLPTFMETHQNIKCDLIIIDGGHTHEVASADFENFQKMANTMHIVLIDDHPAAQAEWSEGPRLAWENGKASGKLHELAACTNLEKTRGISLGFYTLGQ